MLDCILCLSWYGSSTHILFFGVLLMQGSCIIVQVPYLRTVVPNLLLKLSPYSTFDYEVLQRSWFQSWFDLGPFSNIVCSSLNFFVIISIISLLDVKSPYLLIDLQAGHIKINSCIKNDNSRVDISWSVFISSRWRG